MSETTNFKKVRRIILRVFLIVVIAITVIFVLFYANKNTIMRGLVNYLEERQSGEIEFKDINLALFAQFPSISLRIDSLSYWESRELKEGHLPILEANRFYVALDIVELIGGRLEVSKVLLEEGELNLLVHNDSTFNIENAIKSPNAEDSEDSVLVGAVGEIDLDLEELTLRNMVFQMIDSITTNQYKVDLNDVQSSFSSNEDTVALTIRSDFYIHYADVSSKRININRAFQTRLKSDLDRKNKVFTITEGTLSLKGVEFSILGSYDVENNGYVDLTLDATDQDLTLLSLIMREDLVNVNPNLLSSGDIYLGGRIVGETIQNFPEMDFSFGAKDVTIEMPEGIDPITNLTFSGVASTGTASDLSQLSVEIKDVSANIPGGTVNGFFEFENLVTPSINIDLEGEADLDGMHHAFDVGVDSLEGHIQFDWELEATIDIENNEILSDGGSFILDLEEVGFKTSAFHSPIRGLNGEIIEREDTIWLNDVKAATGSNDIQINGTLINVFYYLLEDPNDLSADLDIRSSYFNLTEIIADTIDYGPFNSTVRNLEVDVEVSTNTDNIRNFTRMPSLDANLTHFKAYVDNFTDIRKVVGPVSIYDDTTQLSFITEGIDVETAMGNVDVGKTQLDLKTKEITIDTYLKLTDILPDSVITASVSSDFDPDSIVNDKLNGDVAIKTTFRHTPLSYVDLYIDGDLLYENPESDTFRVQGMDMDITNAEFIDDSLGLRMKSIAGTIDMEELESGIIFEESISTDINGADRVLTINVTSQDHFYEGQGALDLKMDFNNDVPEIFLDYRITDFQLDDFWDRFYEEKIMKGVMSFGMSIRSKSFKRDTLIAHLTGEFVLDAEEIVLYGIDLDEFLKNYRKSQNFRLTDVGAFFLMGPFGPLVTKGFDFAKLAKVNTEDSTMIPVFKADWVLEDGTVTTRDVALKTHENLVAVKGSIDLAQRYINEVVVGVVDKKGCSLLDQSISGTFSEPELGKLNVVGKLFGAVINVGKLVAGNQCEPFYEGELTHPSLDE